MCKRRRITHKFTIKPWKPSSGVTLTVCEFFVGVYIHIDKIHKNKTLSYIYIYIYDYAFELNIFWTISLLLFSNFGLVLWICLYDQIWIELCFLFTCLNSWKHNADTTTQGDSVKISRDTTKPTKIRHRLIGPSCCPHEIRFSFFFFFRTNHLGIN